jgi:transposase-like protein
MTRGRARDRGKERCWRQVLRQWRRSGQGVRQYCAAHGLSEASFYAWRRTVRERDQQAKRCLKPGPPQANDERNGMAGRPFPGRGPTFVPVTVAMPAPSLELVLGAGRVLRVPAGFDAATLRQLLAVLEETPPC